MKVKVDENLPREAADLFRQAGYDAVTVGEEGLCGRPDAVIATVVRHEDRVLVTLDLDFSDIRAYPPEQFAGLVVLRLNHQDKTHVLEVMTRLLPVFSHEEPTGHLWIVEETKVRIRP